MFELAEASLGRLDQNHVNRQVNDAEYNAFLQNLDDLAVCFLVCDMFVLINVLPPPEFLDTVFSA